MLNYKYTEEALLRMVARYIGKNIHFMYGKSHTEEAIKLISKQVQQILFSENHSKKKLLMSIKNNKSPLGV